MTAGREAPDVAYKGDERRRGEQSHAGDRAQPHHDLTRARQGLELALDVLVSSDQPFLEDGRRLLR
jgi:hypothetical protein